ncbi:glycosyltransferase family 2 protein [Robertmurraya beringensis]|uniref:Glycosyltransferase family 2 protein n=1 Tax=Robertmurraya beringensis TaxID=641660 RepID=A0ABV6KS83_9BACI
MKGAEMFAKVSVVVPVYNCELYLAYCLDSILSQTYKNIEVIVINDGSKDKSDEICREYQARDQRIKYEYQENQGPSSARNKGLQLASGDYIAFIDADDTVEKTYIQTLLENLQENNSDLACCGYREINVKGSFLHTDFNFNHSLSLEEIMLMVCSGTGGVLWGKLYKSEIIKNNNIFLDPNIFMSEDLVFVLEYISHCKRFSETKEFLYNYNRLNERSISSNFSNKYLNNSLAVCKQIEHIFNSVKIDSSITRKVIAERIQSTLIKRIEARSKTTWIKKNVLVELKRLLLNDYVKQFVTSFETNNLSQKPYIYFLKNSNLRSAILYGTLLIMLRKIR